uniref:UNC93-like protein MFSD11 n=1 Tax=Meloidogyne javanica TaxID=6303 RepID=A0A915LZ15_MELJA
MAINSQTLNFFQLGIGFFFVFLAFNSQGFIEESVLDSFVAQGVVKRHDGYTRFFSAAPIVGILGTRWALLFGACTYALFQAGFLFLNRFYLFGSSALLGLGAAVIWTAQGKYLALNSEPETAGKHSGLFWALSQACQVCGGIFLLIVFLLHQHSNPEEHFRFGSNFAPSTVKLLYAVFTGITVLGALILGLLPLDGENIGNNRRRHGEDSPSPSELLDPIINPISNQPTGEANILDDVNGTDNEPNNILTSILSMISSIANTELFQLNQGVDPKILLALNAIIQGVGQTYFAIFASIPGDASLGKTFEQGYLIYPR